MISRVTLRNHGPCFVCSAPATGINFTVPTCGPCKAFFRRNAVKLGKVDFICERDGDCPIAYESRRMCNCCRLAKCFRVGMDKSLILSEAEKQARKQLIQQNKQKREQLVVRKKSYSIQPMIIHRLTSTRSTFLLISDQTLLTNIMAAYDNIYIGKDSQQYLHSSTGEHKTVQGFFNQYEERFKLLIEYFKLIPEFNKLSIDDKILLIRNHIGTTIFINGQILKKSQDSRAHNAFVNIFGNNLAKYFSQAVERLNIYRHDPIQLKLVLIIIILSGSINRYHNDTDIDRNYDDTRIIFHGQNIYIELFWRYLLYSLPCEEIVVKFFNKFILDVLFIQHLCFVADQHLANIDYETDQTKPLTRSLCYISNKNR